MPDADVTAVTAWPRGGAAADVLASSTACNLWAIFKQVDGEPGLNDWKIVTLTSKTTSDPDEQEEAEAQVLEGIATMMAEGVRVGGHGAFTTLDEDANGYYVVWHGRASHTRYRRTSS